MKSLLRDFSLSAIIAGFVTAFICITSSVAIVFHAAHALGASQAEIASWIWALGIGMAVTTIVLSLCYRVPVVTAWSTPGAAMLMTGGAGIPLAEATGAFLICALLIILVTFTGWFQRGLKYISIPLVSAMVAGIFLQVALDVFVAMQHRFVLVITMFGVWLLVRGWLPRYAIILSLVAGFVVAALHHELRFENLHFALTKPIFIAPHFSIAALCGIALPLFIVTMAAQNLPAVVSLREYGYEETPISPLIGWTGVTSLLLAPFGAFALNLAVTGIFCMGEEAHADKQRRYVAAVVTGFFYLLLGLFGATVVALFAAVPKELILAIAGIAFFNIIGNSLAMALVQKQDRNAALTAFLVTASGLTLLGVGSVFWGLIAGLFVLGIERLKKVRSAG